MSKVYRASGLSTNNVSYQVGLSIFEEKIVLNFGHKHNI